MIGEISGLVKPTQEQIRAAALPILCLALRNRTGHRRRLAVDAIIMHARERNWTSHFYSRAHESRSYTEALLQLADDTNWAAREIPLPYHLPPRHPRIYYTIVFVHGRPVPVPRPDAIVRARYLYRYNLVATSPRVTRTYERLTEDEFIHPVPFLPAGVPARNYFVSRVPIGTLDPVEMHAFMLEHIVPIYYGLTFERAKKPLNQRGVNIWFDWLHKGKDGTWVKAYQLRDKPYKSWLAVSAYRPDKSLL